MRARIAAHGNGRRMVDCESLTSSTHANQRYLVPRAAIHDEDAAPHQDGTRDAAEKCNEWSAVLVHACAQVPRPYSYGLEIKEMDIQNGGGATGISGDRLRGARDEETIRPLLRNPSSRYVNPPIHSCSLGESSGPPWRLRGLRAHLPSTYPSLYGAPWSSDAGVPLSRGYLLGAARAPRTPRTGCMRETSSVGPHGWRLGFCQRDYGMRSVQWSGRRAPLLPTGRQVAQAPTEQVLQAVGSASAKSAAPR
ncbi:hypothetical protein RJ55_04362 [Drechmeria coniospora]|nr:hypothetical protein RJ55_04362 [Drechmeria coniospora]